MKLRIFITSSNLTTLYMAIFASQQETEPTTDLLLIDAIPLKSSQTQLIKQASALHPFARVCDLSIAKSEQFSAAPSRIKHLTRVLKTKPGFKQIYDFLYSFKLRNEEKKFRQHLLDQVKELQGNYEAIELYTQPTLHLNNSLKALFPKASMHYFEHGMGDYLDVLEKNKENDPFYCVFGEQLRRFHQHKGWKDDFIQTIFSPQAFEEQSPHFASLFPQAQTLQQVFSPDQKIVLMLGQPLHQFKIPPTYWEYFVDMCFAQIDQPEQYLFIIKPHPIQAANAMQSIRNSLIKRGVEVQVLDVPEIQSLSMEVLFYFWQKNIDYIFTPYSSAVFYISRFYPQAQTRCYYSLKSITYFTQHTPDYIKKRWEVTQEYIEAIFSERVQELPDEAPH